MSHGEEQAQPARTAVLSTRGSAAAAPKRVDLTKGTMVGEYEVTGQLGEGGMGTVYGAVHPVIGKKVAIKVLKPEVAYEASLVERFVQEAAAVNKISHPNIIDVFAFGTLDDGRSYFVMERLDGETLDGRLERQSTLSLKEAMPIFRQISDALDAAHATAIIHRDLKPDNVFLCKRADKAVDVRVLDFGVAKLAEGSVNKTQAGSILGTPLFMSPEQCRGQPVDYRTDVYAFGVLVYRVLTGRYPFEAEAITTILYQHVHEKPPPPSSVGAPQTLDPVLLKALAKEPSERYARLGELVDALAKLLAPERTLSVPAPPPSAPEDKTGDKTGDKHPEPATGPLPVSARTPVAMKQLGPVPGPSHPAAGTKPPVRHRTARRTRRPARKTPRPTPDPVAAATPATGSPPSAVTKTAFAIEPGKPPPLVTDLPAWSQEEERRTLKGHTAAVPGLAFSPDGRHLASASADHTVRLWNREGDAVAALSGHKDEVTHVAFSPDASLLASAGTDGEIRVWDVSARALLTTLAGHTAGVTALTFRRGGKQVVSSSKDKTARIWTLATGQSQPLLGHEGPIRDVAVSPTGDCIATASDDKTVRLWDDAQGRRKELRGHQRAVTCVCFSADGKRVAAAGYDGNILEWHVDTAFAHGRVHSLKYAGHKGTVRDLAYSPDGKKLASAGADATTRVWRTDGEPPVILRGHQKRVTHVSFSADSRVLATSSTDGTARTWDLKTQKTTAIVRCEGPAKWVAISPDGHLLAASGNAASVQMAIVPEPKKIQPKVKGDPYADFVAHDKKSKRAIRTAFFVLILLTAGVVAAIEILSP